MSMVERLKSKSYQGAIRVLNKLYTFLNEEQDFAIGGLENFYNNKNKQNYLTVSPEYKGRLSKSFNVLFFDYHDVCLKGEIAEEISHLKEVEYFIVFLKEAIKGYAYEFDIPFEAASFEVMCL